MSSGLDHVGTKLISVRRTDEGIRITALTRSDPPLELTAEEWIDLAKLVMAAKVVADWENEYAT